MKSGIITKIGRPYYYENPRSEKQELKNELRYVQVTCSEGYDYRYFYVKPHCQIGQKIEDGDCIGAADDLTKIWPGMTNHVHFEVKSGDEKLNPHLFFSGQTSNS